MDEQTVFYYRFNSIGVDLSSVNDVEKHSQKLVSFADIEGRLQQLKYAFRNKEKARQDLFVTSVGKTIAELSVYHNIKFKLFSKNLKKQCFSLCLDCNDGKLYFYETDDFDFVAQLFEDFVKNKLPETSKWECVTF